MQGIGRKAMVVATVVAVALAIHGAALAGGEATLGCTAPDNTVPKDVTVKITYPNGKVYTVKATIQPGWNAIEKRDEIAKKVDANKIPNWRVTSDPVEPELTIKDLPKGAIVEFDPSATGEIADTIEIGKIDFGFMAFSGHFAPLDYHGMPAVFTAGLMTEVGVLAEQVSAQELNFQTDGPIICQALFQRLAPRAPQYGAQINYAGDRLEVYFDPAYTVTQGGVIFGTTSPSEGSAGGALMPEGPDCNGNLIPDELDLANGTSQDCNGNLVPDECDIASGLSHDFNANGIPDECEIFLGDMNCDGAVNNQDIDAFVQALFDPAGYLAAHDGDPQAPCNILNGDFTLDGALNNQDIDGFVAALFGH